MFTHPNGTPLIPVQITQDFASVIKRFGLPHLTFHGLRHAFATLGTESGLAVGIAPATSTGHFNTPCLLLRLVFTDHSKIGITMDLYSHVIPDMQDELADAVADVLTG